jgi:hypothetical protein
MKYFLSLCCIIKDEKYLEEFIIYHHIVGVEHFYIYDNESSIPIKNRLTNPFFKKLCSIIDYPGKIKQIEAYRDCIQKTKKITDWLMIIDGDEYVLPKQNFWSIRDILTLHKEAHALGINWIIFGTSFHQKEQKGFLTDKYRYCSKKQDRHIKTICRPRFVKHIGGPHNVELFNPKKNIDVKGNIISGPFNLNYTTDIIQINHYMLKSHQEAIKKHKRGRADVNGRISLPKNIKELDNKDNDIIDNYLANKYLPHIKLIKNKYNLVF